MPTVPPQEASKVIWMYIQTHFTMIGSEEHRIPNTSNTSPPEDDEGVNASLTPEVNMPLCKEKHNLYVMPQLPTTGDVAILLTKAQTTPCKNHTAPVPVHDYQIMTTIKFHLKDSCRQTTQDENMQHHQNSQIMRLQTSMSSS
jgi:hypothetical protein